MNASIAACVGSTFLYWNGIIIAFGIAAGFLLMYSLYTAHSGPGSGTLAAHPRCHSRNPAVRTRSPHTRPPAWMQSGHCQGSGRPHSFAARTRWYSTSRWPRSPGGWGAQLSGHLNAPSRPAPACPAWAGKACCPSLRQCPLWSQAGWLSIWG